MWVAAWLPARPPAPSGIACAALLALVALVALAGCGDDGPASPDAGAAPGARLVVLDPPGDSLGLPPSSQATLRVRYETETGEPIVGGRVSWALVAGRGEGTGGATLSASASDTDDLGVARVDVSTGTEGVSFRVAADAPSAPRATFYIAVSASGFTSLVVTPQHQGFRDADVFHRVELRLYLAGVQSCGELAAATARGELPESPFPPRSLAGFGGSAEFLNLMAGQGLTLLGWATGADATPLSIGCLDLGAAPLPPSLALIGLPVVDRLPRLPDVVPLESRIDLSPVAAALAAAGVETPWRILACDAGAGQLLLDCLIDALVGDGEADCTTAAADIAAVPLAAAIDAARSPLDDAGCRPATGLDAAIAAAVATGGSFPTGLSLDSLLSIRTATFGHVTLDSTWQPLGASPELGTDVDAGLPAPDLQPAEQPLRHRLSWIDLDVGGISVAVDLRATALPVISADTTAHLAADGTLTLPPHAFSLRLGRWLDRAFTELGLAPLGLADRASSLGTALASSLDDGAGHLGCIALSTLACTAAAYPTSCAVAACDTMLPSLDAHLTAWSHLLDGPGLDLHLTATAPIRDLDADLIIDPFGQSGTPSGSWTVDLILATGASLSTTADLKSPMDLP